MTEETRSPDAVEEIEQPDIETRIAEKVRYDSRERSRLTGVDAIETLFTDDDPDVQFAEMTQKEQFADIKWVVAEGGATYFYSDQFLTTDVATRESAIEQAITSIVEQVRAESKEIKLTPLETVQAQLPEELADDVDLVLDRIAELPQNEDIARVAGPAAVYLHSLTHISGSYARMMARSEGDDPCWTIADTPKLDPMNHSDVNSTSRIASLPFTRASSIGTTVHC